MSSVSTHPGRHTRRSSQGFALLEMLLAFGLGLSVCTLMLQAVLAEGQNGQRLGRVLRERQVAERAFALMRQDLQRATALASAEVPPSCSLSGRTVVLHLQTPDGPITYTAGKPSEPIWRGAVLMRCGPAFGLDGMPSTGKAVNRVLFDGLLSVGGAQAVQPSPGALRVELRQQFVGVGATSQVLVHRQLLPLP